MLEWWNGRHEGLKILWSLRPCGFESRFEHRHPSVKPSPTASRTDFSFTNCPDFFTMFIGEMWIDSLSDVFDAGVGWDAI